MKKGTKRKTSDEQKRVEAGSRQTKHLKQTSSSSISSAVISLHSM
jgi:hypothetical protein